VDWLSGIGVADNRQLHRCARGHGYAKFIYDFEVAGDRLARGHWIGDCASRHDIPSGAGFIIDHLAISDRVRGSLDSRAVRLWWMADGVFRRRRSARAEKEFAARV